MTGTPKETDAPEYGQESEASWWQGLLARLTSAIGRTSSRVATALPAYGGLSVFLYLRSGIAHRLSRAVGKVKFWIHRRSYLTEEQFDSARVGTGASFGLLALSRGPLLLAAGVVLTLTLAQPWLNDQLSRLGLGSAWNQPRTDGVYSNVLTTVAAATAGLLALFFATVGVIVSTAYVRVTTEVRFLIFNDRLNRRYLKLNAHVAAVATLGLVVYEFRDLPSTALILYLGAAGAICLLGFFPVGIRVFALFDPSSLVAEPCKQVRRGIACAQAGHQRWSAPSFQLHARKTVESHLRMLRDLSSLALDEKRTTNTSVIMLTGWIQGVSRWYADRQLTIPTESQWFPRRAHYAQWQATDSSRTGLALATGTMQQPESRPYRGFVHDDLREITCTSLTALLKQGDAADAATLLLDVIKTATTLAERQDQEEAQALVTATQECLVEWLISEGPKGASPETVISVVDVQCVSALAPVLNTSLALCNGGAMSRVAVEHQMRECTGTQLYQARHPRRVLIRLEDLHRRIQFERDLDPSAPAETWFLRHMAVMAYAEHARTIATGILGAVETNFIAPAVTLLQAGAFLPAGFWLLRGVEACSKAANQIELLDGFYVELEQSCAFEMDWTPSGFEKVRDQLEELRKTTLVHLAETVDELTRTDLGTALPDIVGDVRARLGDYLVSMMAAKDLDMKSFAKLFAAYFASSFAVVQRLVSADPKPVIKETVGPLALDALLDLLDMSGLAFLYSELDGTDYGSVVKAAWDQRVSQHPNKTGFLQFCYATIDARLSLPFATAGAMQRQHWSQLLVRSMADRGVGIDRDEYLFAASRRRQQHGSDVIESIHGTLGHMFTEPNDFFAALYISKAEPAAELEPPKSVQTCLEDIRLAAERRRDPGTSEDA